MGIEYFIGDKSIRLASATWYNEFLNWVADVEAEGGIKFPSILSHSPVEGIYHLDKKARASLYSGSAYKLKEEAEALLKSAPPDFAEYILRQILKACDLSVLSGKPISLTYPEWDG